MQDVEENGENIFGQDFQEYLNKDHFNLNPSLGTGKNETGANTSGNNSLFEKIDEINNYHPQTELKKDDIKNKEKFRFKPKKNIERNSFKDLNKVLQKKTSRGDVPTKKRKKTKTDMDYTLKNKTEINPEIKKKRFRKKNL